MVRTPPFILVCALAACGRGEEIVHIGSKNFTESILLGEILAQSLEAKGLTVNRRFNLGGTFIAHEAIRSGELDSYVEYTGTAHSAVLGLPRENDPAVVLAVVDSTYRERWDLVWSEPLGFSNTFAILVRGEDARRLSLTDISSARPYTHRWVPGFGHEFMDRSDGYSGFVEHYDLEFARQPVVMDLGLVYRALAEERVDLVAGNSTDGQIRALDLFHLSDDRSYFPPYQAVPVVRRDALERHPEIGEALNELGGTIDEAAMIEMNFLVDVERRDIAEVARAFLNVSTGAGP